MPSPGCTSTRWRPDPEFRMNNSNPRLLAMLATLLPAAVALGQVPAVSPFSTGGGGRAASFPSNDGKVIYEHICQSCHMADGQGGKLSPAVYPALAGNAKLAARAYPAMMVVNGLGAMPAFGSMLNDEQIAALVNYLRGNFGNKFTDALSATEVRGLRPATQTAPTELRGR
jgi:mono/diheme cytochrome c family protein